MFPLILTVRIGDYIWGGGVTEIPVYFAAFVSAISGATFSVSVSAISGAAFLLPLAMLGLPRANVVRIPGTLIRHAKASFSCYEGHRKFRV